VAAILAQVRQLLDPTRNELGLVAEAFLTAKVVSLVEQQGVSHISIAAMPPGGSAPTRYPCKWPRTQSPECKIVVGDWEFTANIKEKRAFLLGGRCR
jgi:hypothetical protein